MDKVVELAARFTTVSWSEFPHMLRLRRFRFTEGLATTRICSSAPRVECSCGVMPSELKLAFSRDSRRGKCE